jgi:hypothetical protein
MKMPVFLVLLVIIFFPFIGCTKYTYVGTDLKQTVFLEIYTGRLLYVDGNNQVCDVVELGAPNLSTANKEQAASRKDMGTETVEDAYEMSLTIRYYNGKLLYTTYISPYDDQLSRLSNTITVYLGDNKGFWLETFQPKSWVRTIGEDGHPISLHTSGSIPITLRDYFEIKSWSPSWVN